MIIIFYFLNIYMIIFVVILVLLFFVLSMNYVEPFNHSLYKEISPSVRQELYDIMKVVDQTFSSGGINYWIEAGTLLGAIRHHDLIPWDDDLDIQIKASDEKRLLLLKPELEKQGYQMSKWWGGYKIYSMNGKKGEYSWKYPFCDIFLMEYFPEKQIYHYQSEKARKYWPEGYMRKSDLHVLKDYQLGPLKVKGPKNCYDYLNRQYGETWPVIAYQQYDHDNEKHLTRKKFILSQQISQLPYIWINENENEKEGDAINEYIERYKRDYIIIKVNKNNIKKFIDDSGASSGGDVLTDKILLKYGGMFITNKLHNPKKIFHELSKKNIVKLNEQMIACRIK